ncbi:UNVERIFIED_CONTAM: hypothetical protein Sradi_5419400, partial [Sesamum radiatum]
IISKNSLTVILDNNKFIGTNYTDWLRNLRIVLDYGRQGYIMDKLFPQTLSDRSSSEERETFERWHADHRKVKSIILVSISNDVQKQYDRLDDVASILQCMKEIYAIPDRHTKYVATKEFFRAKMTEGSSVQEHGVKMLSLVEKFEDIKVGLDNDTYIDVIFQSLSPSYDPFIVKFNMNRLEDKEAVLSPTIKEGGSLLNPAVKKAPRPRRQNKEKTFYQCFGELGAGKKNTPGYDMNKKKPDSTRFRQKH